MILDFLIACILFVQVKAGKFQRRCAELITPNDGITNRVVWFQKRYINRDDILAGNIKLTFNDGLRRLITSKEIREICNELLPAK